MSGGTAQDEGDQVSSVTGLERGSVGGGSLASGACGVTLGRHRLPRAPGAVTCDIPLLRPPSTGYSQVVDRQSFSQVCASVRLLIQFAFS